jgi:hypothetical protein
MYHSEKNTTCRSWGRRLLAEQLAGEGTNELSIVVRPQRATDTGVWRSHWNSDEPTAKASALAGE